YFIPRSTIVTVNSASISQQDYRKLLAYTAQDEWNSIQTKLTRYNDLTEKAMRGDTTGKTEFAVLTSQLQVAKQDYAQGSITQHAIDVAVEDQLIQRGVSAILKTHPDAKAQLVPVAADVDTRLKAFKAAFPKGQTYADFLSKNSMDESDVRTAITMYLRRDKMQGYLAGQLTQTINQAHLRRIELGDSATATKILNQLKAQHLTDKSASWGDIAKVNSLDVDSKNAGGDMGFVAPGTSDAGIELWAFDPARKVGDLSIVHTAGGTFDIVQVLDFAQKQMTSEQLSAAQGNALDHWLSGQRVAPSVTVGKADTDALTASRNLPVTPDLNATLPNFTPQVPTTSG
ncbi:MAG TPA: peptidylprolyl isomerase, partial [Ktedonobacterales bacterium]